MNQLCESDLTAYSNRHMNKSHMEDDTILHCHIDVTPTEYCEKFSGNH